MALTNAEYIHAKYTIIHAMSEVYHYMHAVSEMHHLNTCVCEFCNYVPSLM